MNRMEQNINTEWFSGFFSKISEKIKIVLSSKGCREGWIQGELYRYAHEEGIKCDVNARGINGSKYCIDACFYPKQDDTTPNIVCEIKVIGYEKNYAVSDIDGRGNVERILEETSDFVPEFEGNIEANPNRHSLLKDYRKLNSDNFSEMKRILILVRPDCAEGLGNNALRRALDKVQFSNRVPPQDFMVFSGFSVKVWNIE